MPSNQNSNVMKDGWPEEGFVRLDLIVGPGCPLPIGKSTWWAGVKSGRFPKPVKLGPGITAWRVVDLRAMMAGWSV